MQVTAAATSRAFARRVGRQMADAAAARIGKPCSAVLDPITKTVHVIRTSDMCELFENHVVYHTPKMETESCPN